MIVLVVVVIAVIGVAAWFYLRQRRTAGPRESFGPEYDRARREHPDQRSAQDRASAHEPREAGMTVAASPMTEPSMATPGATAHAASDAATANRRKQSPPDAIPLFPAGEATSFRARWGEAQTSFVDEPHHAVEQADSLVAEMMQRLASVFADERSTLEQQWCRGDNISTEYLRVALRRYRSFLDRLLSV